MSKQSKSSDKGKGSDDTRTPVPNLNVLRRPKPPKKDTANKPRGSSRTETVAKVYPSVVVDVAVPDADANKHKKRRTDDMAGSSQDLVASLQGPGLSDFDGVAVQDYSTAIKSPSATTAISTPAAVPKSSSGPAKRTATQTTIDSRTLDRVLKIEERNREDIKVLVQGQDAVQQQLHAQQLQLDQILQLLNAAAAAAPDTASTSTSTSTPKKEFYSDFVKTFASELFHAHKSHSDEQLKALAKEKMEADNDLAKQLRKLSAVGTSFDDLWSKKLLSAVLQSYRTKKGYYIRRVKNSLWSTFGRSRITPFADDFNKDQMQKWKESAEVRKVYEDLYNPIDPHNPNSDTYLAAIIRSVFTAKECSPSNVTWTQAVLESIFDKNHLSAKIDAEIVEKWTENLSRNDSSSRSGGSKSSTSPEDGEVDASATLNDGSE